MNTPSNDQQPAGPLAPSLLRGSLTEMKGQRISRRVVFQYNPESLKRSLQPRLAGGETGNRSNEVRFTGAPVEKIDLEILLDASDQLDKGEQVALRHGVLPLLNVLELLIYPAANVVQQNINKLKHGAMMVAPPAAPLVLFNWGGDRAIPVAPESMQVSEQLFDNQLNPVRATVSLSLRVLSYTDLSPTEPGFGYFMTYLSRKRKTAKLVYLKNPH